MAPGCPASGKEPAKGWGHDADDDEGLDPTMIPSAAEPFFMNLDAAIELTPAMNLEDMKQGVAKAMKRG